MNEMSGYVETGLSLSYRWQRVFRLIGLTLLIVLGFLACNQQFAWFPSLVLAIPHAILRKVAIVFLYGLLFGYVIVLLAAVLGMLVACVAVARSRGVILKHPRLARLFLLNVSLLLCLAMMEISAAVWSGWLHRSPGLPNARPGPVLPLKKLASNVSDRKLTEAGGPLRILVIGESSAGGNPITPGFR